MKSPVVNTIYTPDIEAALAERLRISRAFAGQIMFALMDILQAHIINDNRVALRNFGIFHLKGVGDRYIKTLYAGTVHVPAGVCPAFKPFQSFKARARRAYAERTYGASAESASAAPKRAQPPPCARRSTERKGRQCVGRRGVRAAKRKGTR